MAFCPRRCHSDWAAADADNALRVADHIIAAGRWRAVPAPAHLPPVACSAAPFVARSLAAPCADWDAALLSIQSARSPCLAHAAQTAVTRGLRKAF